MKVEVQLFAIARQRAKREKVEVEIRLGATVAQLRIALAEQCPVIGSLLPGVRLAVNSEYASDHQVIPAGAEIALIPPVSGG